jgi:hypothetical protein
VKSFVEPDVLCLFIDAITGKHITFNLRNVIGLGQLSGEFGFWSFSSTLSSFLTSRIASDSVNCTIQTREETTNQISDLKADIERRERWIACLECQLHDATALKNHVSRLQSDFVHFRREVDTILQSRLDSVRRLQTTPTDVRKAETKQTPPLKRNNLNSGRRKCTLIGPVSGKTSLLSRLRFDKFDENTASTIGATFEIYKMSSHGQDIELAIWDTPGQEKYRMLVPLWLRRSDGALVVFDMTNRDTFSVLSQFLELVHDSMAPTHF